MMTKEALGKAVRQVWVEWASEQFGVSSSRPDWFQVWDEMPNNVQNVHCLIGERLYQLGMIDAAQNEELHQLRKLRQALDVLQKNGDDVLLSMSRHEACVYVMEPRKEFYMSVEDESMWADALIKLAEWLEE